MSLMTSEERKAEVQEIMSMLGRLWELSAGVVSGACQRHEQIGGLEMRSEHAEVVQAGGGGMDTRSAPRVLARE